ncbi:MAG: hypothetical protein AAF547_06495 [Actinomycetota bacterium]
MTRRLTSTDQAQALNAAARIIKVIAGGQGRHILQAIREAADVGYPSSSSTAPRQPHHAVDDKGKPLPALTVPEAHADHPDQGAADAARVATKYRRWVRDTVSLADDLEGFAQVRLVRVCPRCKYPLPADSTKCHRTVDGKLCGAREGDEKRYCRTCGDEIKPGQKSWNGEDDKCRKKTERRRNKENARATTEQERGTGTITTDGLLDTDRLIVAEQETTG